jgi:hypothetical protein
VVDEFSWGFNENYYYYAVGCADDIAILINGKFSQTVSEVLQTALGTVQQWCKTHLLSTLMVQIPYTRRKDIRGLEDQALFCKTIQLSTEIKYPGQSQRIQGLQVFLDLQRHVQENMQTESKGGVLDIHHSSKTCQHLCCHSVVAKLNQFQRMACTGKIGAIRMNPTAAV